MRQVYNKDSYGSFFKSGKTSIPNIRLKILPEPPKNFKISSTYKNGKISNFKSYQHLLYCLLNID